MPQVLSSGPGLPLSASSVSSQLVALNFSVLTTPKSFSPAQNALLSWLLHPVPPSASPHLPPTPAPASVCPSASGSALSPAAQAEMWVSPLAFSHTPHPISQHLLLAPPVKYARAGHLSPSGPGYATPGRVAATGPTDLPAPIPYLLQSVLSPRTGVAPLKSKSSCVLPLLDALLHGSHITHSQSQAPIMACRPQPLGPAHL